MVRTVSCENLLFSGQSRVVLPDKRYTIRFVSDVDIVVGVSINVSGYRLRFKDLKAAFISSYYIPFYLETIPDTRVSAEVRRSVISKEWGRKISIHVEDTLSERRVLGVQWRGKDDALFRSTWRNLWEMVQEYVVEAVLVDSFFRLR